MLAYRAVYVYASLLSRLLDHTLDLKTGTEQELNARVAGSLVARLLALSVVLAKIETDIGIISS